MELHASEPLSRIVIIEGIQSGTSESSLREQLLDFLNKYNLQLVFLETANESNALCNTDSGMFSSFYITRFNFDE